MEIIDLCGGDALCMEPADRLVKITFETNGSSSSRHLKLCAYHLAVIREHAARRCKEDPSLKIVFHVAAPAGS